MRRSELKNRTDNAVEQTKNALQTVYDSLNRGQQLQLLKLDYVKKLFDRYNIEYNK